MAFDPVSLAITAGATYLGNKLEQHHQGNIKDDDIARLQALGLTPQEIAGSGAGSGGVGAGGTVLGNSAGQMAVQKQQQAYEMQEREKDRAVALQGQRTGLAQTQIAAQASLGSASLSANASRYAADLRSAVDLARVEMDRMRLPGELANLANQNATSSPDFQRYMKMLSMSPANVAAANAALGLPFDPLDADAVAAATPSQRAQVLQILIAMSSTSYREAIGLKGTAQEQGSIFGSWVADNLPQRQTTLGNAPRPDVTLQPTPNDPLYLPPAN